MKKNTIVISDNDIAYYLEEIKSMRDEINWRVKMAYTGSLIFLSAIIIPLSSFFQADNTLVKEIKENPDTLTVVGIIALLAISAWAGVQNANHIVEKRIELYTLELMKVVSKFTGYPHASWLGFLYGNSFFKNKTQTTIAKYLNASIGFFIYFLPNIVALTGWIGIIAFGKISEYSIWFVIATIFVFITICSTFMFFFYVNKVNKLFTEFYEKKMSVYFEKFN